MNKTRREFEKLLESEGIAFRFLREGNHFVYRLYFGTVERSFTISKTASDWRVVRNNISVLRKLKTSVEASACPNG